MCHRRADRVVFLVTIGLVVMLLVAGFAWAGGWIGPSRIGGYTLVEALKGNGDTYPGYLSAHAKGPYFDGYFDANGAGVALSSASVLAVTSPLADS